jgi:hypothetical protein
MTNCKNKNYYLIMGVLLTASSGFAGEKAGNGGKGVFCPMPDGSKKLFILDYDRAVNEWQMSIRTAPGKDEIEKAVGIVRRLAPLDPSRASRYEAGIREFYSRVTWHQNLDFSITPDSKELGYCKGGELAQVVVQSRGDFPWDQNKLYQVNRELWDLLDADQKAGMILHEVILKETILYGQEFSDFASWFNALISSGAVTEMSPDDYRQLLLDLELSMTREVLEQRLNSQEARDALKVASEQVAERNEFDPYYSNFDAITEALFDGTALAGSRFQISGLMRSHYVTIPTIGKVGVATWEWEHLKKVVSSLHSTQYLVLTFGREDGNPVIIAARVVE